MGPRVGCSASPPHVGGPATGAAAAVGEVVASEEGEALRDAVGPVAAVGAGVGPVGTALGLVVGIGKYVGTQLGEEGLRDGLDDGLLVGLALGLEVGAAVGDPAVVG